MPQRRYLLKKYTVSVSLFKSNVNDAMSGKRYSTKSEKSSEKKEE